MATTPLPAIFDSLPYPPLKGVPPIFFFIKITTKDVLYLDYLDGLGHFLFGLGWQGKNLKGVVTTPLGRMRVKAAENFTMSAPIPILQSENSIYTSTFSFCKQKSWQLCFWGIKMSSAVLPVLFPSQGATFIEQSPQKSCKAAQIRCYSTLIT